VGRISEAREAGEAGRFVEVLDDTNGGTGGAFVCTWSTSEGFDGWVESIDEVDEYVGESGWEIEWFDVPPPEALAGRPKRP